jgi:hypothetical protein
MRKQRKRFFFEKKKQKTFEYWAEPIQRRPPGDKSFLVLFFKKELLPTAKPVPVMP